MTQELQELEAALDGEDFYFDDEPLEQLLYGTGASPSPVGIFSATRRQIRKALQQLAQDEPRKALEEISELADDRYHLGRRHLAELAAILRDFIPLVPCPTLKCDLGVVGALLDRMWDLERGGPPGTLGETIGQLHFRQHEHLEQFEEARQVMAVLIKYDQAANARVSLAVDTNNYAVEYLLEKRWSEAAPLLEEAAEMMSELGLPREWAAMRANYLHCRWELEGLRIGAEFESELHRLRQIQIDGQDWRERKVLVLLARIREAQGDLPGAIAFVERAIEIGATTQTRWPEIDGRYLARLRAKAEETCSQSMSHLSEVKRSARLSWKPEA